MQSAQSGQCRRSDAQQESSQRGGVGITRQPSEVLKDSVLTEQRSRFDTFEPEDHRIQQCEKHLAHAVAMVTLHQLNILTESSFEADASQEPMKEIDSSVVRQGARAEGNPELAGSSRHSVKSYLKGSFQRKMLCLYERPATKSK